MTAVLRELNKTKELSQAERVPPPLRSCRQRLLHTDRNGRSRKGGYTDWTDEVLRYVD